MAVRIVFDTHESGRVELEVTPTGSLMEAARAHGVPGIDADCGGYMVCGTCHVVIEPMWHDRLPPQSDAERDMLECVPDPEPNTRLSCQIPITEALNGIVMRVPKRQR
jgi:2Fe-2S ferredoxin